jgi:hypothetical protein
VVPESSHPPNLAESRKEVDVTLFAPAHHDNWVSERRGRSARAIINIRSENYRIDPAKESELNLLGEEGWELVAITAINYKSAATDHIGMVFKRRKA